MRSLTLSNLKLGLRNLFADCHAALAKSHAGKLYGPMLQAKKEAIDALPPALTGGTPLAAELDAADARHDGFGAMIFFTTETYLREPDGKLATAAQLVRDTFIPSLDVLQARYVDEAQAALDHEPLLKQHKADLDLFPLAGKRTLYHVAADFVSAGVALHDLLDGRANIPKGARKDAAKLRGETFGLLSRLRQAIRDEVAHDTKAPRELEAQVFAFFDEIEKKQRAAAKVEAPAPAVPAATTDKRA